MKLTQIPTIDFPFLESATLRDEFAGGGIGTIVSELVKYLFPLAGLLLLLYLIYGGYRYMLSRGDPKTLQEAKGVITNALLGFVIVFISFWLVQIVGTILGLDVIVQIF